MTAKTFTIFAGQQTWHVAAADGDDVQLSEVAADPHAGPDQVAAAVRRSLDQIGYLGQSVLLTIPSTWCLSANITTTGLPRKQRHRAMAYRLEEHLPLAAEDVVCDFVASVPAPAKNTEKHGHVLGVAAQTDQLKQCVDAFENTGIAVGSICPTALLAAQSAATRQDNGHCDAALSQDGDRVNLITFRNGRPENWFALPQNQDDIALYLNTLTVDRPAPLQVVDYRDTAIGPPVAQIAHGVLTGATRPWIDLRRGDLAVKDRLRSVRRPLNVACCAALVFAIVLPVTMGWRGNTYDRQARAFDDQQRALFAHDYPGKTVPVNVKSRFASEARRLEGLSGASDQIPAQQSALAQLHHTLGQLPRELRYRILELRIDTGTLYLAGEARSHSDADAIAAALRHGPGVNVEPPRTETLQDKGTGVAFTITAVVKGTQP